jgi:hypothetical protein
MKKLISSLGVILLVTFLNTGLNAECWDFSFNIVEVNPNACMGDGSNCFLRICNDQ